MEEIIAPAKVNLTLDIIKKNKSGCHNIESVLQQLELHDTIILESINKQCIKINCKKYICPDEENLAYKAAELLIKNFKINKGVEITIEKNIPIVAGLGGGSSDAAATLEGMKKLFNLKLSKEELIENSNNLGRDIAFCLLGGTAYATEEGNIIQKIEQMPFFYVVLAKPRFGISAEYAYKNLDYKKIGKERKTAEMLNAINEENIEKIAKSMHNDFEYSVCKKYPIINEIKKKMIEYGALNALMSGSGPTVFGITREKSVAEEIYKSLTQELYFKENLDFVCITQTR